MMHHTFKTKLMKREKMVMIKYLKIVSYFCLITTLLSGCSGMHSDFDCNAVGGIQGCATLGQVNNMADQGNFDRAALDAKALSATSASPTGYTSNNDATNLSKPLRDNDEVQTVWIAPYTTKDGSYIWASMATVVIQPGHWINAPSSVTKNQDI